MALRAAAPAVLALLLMAAGAALVEAQDPSPPSPQPPAGAATPGPVLLLDVDGAITRATDMYLEEGLEAARMEGAQAIVLRLNTPGGGLAETFQMTDRISASGIPVIGYVAPATANAWSAGTVILLSTHVAAMAPFTVIGSSQPVALGEGGFTPINDSKIINALVGKLRALAAAHGRNETAAEEFVTKNLNLNADQALAAGVIERVAPDVRALLQAVDGTVVSTPQGNVTLRTANAPVREAAPSVRVLVFSVFSDPMIAGLLMLVGIYALIFGLGAPGHGAEVAGVVLVLLALAGLGFNINLVGLGLIGLGAALLLLELHSPGFGAFGVAGLVALVIGTVFLAPLSPTGPGQWAFPADYQQRALVILSLPSLLLAGFLAFGLYKVREVQRRKPAIGEGMVGEEAEATTPLGPGKEGFVTHKGEAWQAVSDWELAPGDRVVIRAKDGPVLRVEPVGGRPPSPGAPPSPPAAPPSPPAA